MIPANESGGAISTSLSLYDVPPRSPNALLSSCAVSLHAFFRRHRQLTDHGKRREFASDPPLLKFTFCFLQLRQSETVAEVFLFIPMMRENTNRAQRFFSYDSFSNKSTCQIEDCQHVVCGDLGRNLERHLQGRHKQANDKWLAEKAVSTKRVVLGWGEDFYAANLRQAG